MRRIRRDEIPQPTEHDTAGQPCCEDSEVRWLLPDLYRRDRLRSRLQGSTGVCRELRINKVRIESVACALGTIGGSGHAGIPKCNEMSRPWRYISESAGLATPRFAARGSSSSGRRSSKECQAVLGPGARRGDDQRSVRPVRHTFIAISQLKCADERGHDHRQTGSDSTRRQ